MIGCYEGIFKQSLNVQYEVEHILTREVTTFLFAVNFTLANILHTMVCVDSLNCSPPLCWRNSTWSNSSCTPLDADPDIVGDGV